VKSYDWTYAAECCDSKFCKSKHPNNPLERTNVLEAHVEDFDSITWCLDCGAEKDTRISKGEISRYRAIAICPFCERGMYYRYNAKAKQMIYAECRNCCLKLSWEGDTIVVAQPPVSKEQRENQWLYHKERVLEIQQQDENDISWEYANSSYGEIPPLDAYIEVDE